MSEASRITIDPPRPVPGKPGVFTFVSRNGAPLHSDEFRPSVASRVKGFIRETFRRAYPDREPAEYPPDVRKEFERQFAEWAVTLSGNPDAPAVSPTEPVEVDVSRIARPELFHTPAVSGLTVAVMTTVEGKLVPRWRTYLRWADGRREVIDRPASIALPGGTTMYVHPDPGEPPTNEPPAWSATARGQWVKGQVETEPAALFQRLLAQIAHYPEFDPDTAHGATATIALWVVLSYVYPAWNAVPYLYIGGPMSSGKTRLLELLARLVFRSLVSANITAPTIFRTLHAHGGCLLYDEAERLRQDRPDMQDVNTVFLAGYKRGATATRLEPVGDTFRPVQFEVYGPKVLACIAGLPATLASRCITLMMFRAAADSEKPKRRLDADPGGWARLRDDLHALALDNGPDWIGLTDLRDVVPAGVNGRNFELWQPLLALAKWFESRGVGGLLDLVKRHALRSVGEAQDDAVPEADETLLELLAEAVRAQKTPTAGELLAGARERSPATFDKWQANTVTKRFKTYGIRAPKKSNGRREYRHVTLKVLSRIQERYGIDLGCDAGPGRNIDPDRP